MANKKLRLLSGFGVVTGTSGDKARGEGAEESLAPAARVVHELEEAEVVRQLLLRDAPMRAALRAYVANTLFILTDDPDRKTRILDGMSSAPQHVLVSAFEGLRDYDPAEAAGGLSVPGLSSPLTRRNRGRT